MLSSLKSWVFGHPDNSGGESESENDEEILEIPTEIEANVLDGKVTHLTEDFGLIDNRYQFGRTLHPKINYGGPLRVGTLVRFRVERPKDRGDTVEWTVTDLLTAGTQSGSGWDEEGREGHTVAVMGGHDDSVEGREIGCVTSSTRDTVTASVRTQSGMFNLKFGSNVVAKVPHWSPHKGVIVLILVSYKSNFFALFTFHLTHVRF